METQRPEVAVVRCPDYTTETVYAAVKHSLELLGGIEAHIAPGSRVMLKPNLVRSMPPERGATTHPAVVAAVARLVVEAGSYPIIVESPGGPYTPATLRTAYRRTGMDAAAESSGAILNYDTGASQVAYPEGKLLHRLDVINPLLEADAVINLPKLKTHNLTVLTMGAKNLFGVVPGSLKIGYHSKLVERDTFCDGLVDIVQFVRPALTVMDAVVGMEGEGPTGGKPRTVGALVASANVWALDTVGASLVGVDPLLVTTTRMAVQRGLATGRLEDVNLLGEPFEALCVSDFEKGIDTPIDPGLVPKPLRFMVRMAQRPGAAGSTAGASSALRSLAQGWIWKQLVARPRATERCVACGFCVKHCPVQAITIINRRATMNSSVCIRCYCCHELCPHDAVLLEKPLLGRLVTGK
ncbi:MAG: DUF362 domain-containing protein [Anaerolineae bacterium]|jgi:uncharacterized protein (DUF362 family)/ferredoxin